MGRQRQLFLGAFLITVIFIGTLCGFMVVDMSTERYMPGRFAPIFLISSVGEYGVELSVMGTQYHIGPEVLVPGTGEPGQLWGIAPTGMQMAGLLAGRLYLLTQPEEILLDEAEQVLLQWFAEEAQ